MNIALLYPPRDKHSTGVRNLAKGTIIETLKADTQNHYYFCDDPYFDCDVKAFSNVKWGGSAEECARYDFLCYCKKIDLVHSYWNTFESMQADCAKLITIHDLIPLVHPEWHTMRDYFDTVVRWSAEKSDLILTNSEYTKKDIVDYYHIAPEKVIPIYPGLLHSLDFSYSDKAVLDKFEIRHDYIMSVSTIEPRKNLRGLINGFIEFKRRHPASKLQLVLVGGIGWDRTFEQDINRLDEYRDSIVLTGFVTDLELSALYCNALAVGYVSFYEGFGLPILEALAAGKAVISSDTTSMPEVGGDAVCYCDPYRVESIADAIEQVVTDDACRTRLEALAPQQAAKFSYAKAAAETIAVYNKFGGR